ncbi:MAG: cobalamin transport system permease protein [Candidatus Atribacteria bacterium]|nr:cobalamin transport system permease protein [Candidatus Atribacteria bacterium]
MSIALKTTKFNSRQQPKITEPDNTTKRSSQKVFLWEGGLIVGLLLSFLLALSFGRGRFQSGDFWAIFHWQDISPLQKTILFQVRMPRVTLATLVGGGLSISGAVLQGLFRNPLVDPYILGISSGASFGAVLAILKKWNFGLYAVPFSAFSFALLTTFLVFSLGQVNRKTPLETLLLSGVAVGFFFSALVSLSMFFAGHDLHQIVFWLMGGLWNRSWREVKMVLPFLSAGIPFMLAFHRELNIMLLGEKTAESMGVDIERVKRWLVFACSLVVASCVAASGVIGFVGLIVPHVVRLLFGQNHRLLLPFSFLSGGIILLWADTAARSILNPVELPVGVITSLLGAPFFIYLLRKRKKLHG